MSDVFNLVRLLVSFSSSGNIISITGASSMMINERELQVAICLCHDD